MNEEKKRRVVSAVVSGVVMLLFVLTAIVVYQLVGIFVRKNRIEQLDAEIARLEQQIQDTDSEIEEWSQRWKIEQRARELGLIYENDDE